MSAGSTVLIVDDSLTVRMDLADAFAAAGFKPLPCGTAREAREAWGSSPVDLIVLDVLFESLAREYGPGAVAALLTGMGRDGAAGLLEIRRAGGVTIAQDEATSVVYGMPREAVRLGAAEQVLALDEIGPALAAAVATGGPK